MRKIDQILFDNMNLHPVPLDFSNALTTAGQIGAIQHGVNEAIDTVNANGEEMELAFEQYKKDNTIEHHMDELKEFINENVTDVIINPLVEHYNVQLEDHHSDIEELKSSTGSLTTNVTTINDAITSITDQVGTIDTTVAELSDDVLQLGTGIDVVNQASFLQIGKKYAFLGDSIMFGQIANNGTQGLDNIPATFQAITKCAVADNLGIMGATMSTSPVVPEATRYNGLATRVDTIDFTQYDGVFIMLGINDFAYGVELGFVEDTRKSTFYGSMNYSINKILANHPKCKVVLMTPIYHSWIELDGNTAFQNTLSQFVHAIKRIANKYSLPCIDMFYGAGINKYNYINYYWDLTHPTNDTYKILGEYIAKQYPYRAYTDVEKAGTRDILTPANLIQYGDFTVSGIHSVFNLKPELENGVTLTLSGTKTFSSTRKYKFIADKFYTITFASKLTNQTLATNLLLVDLFEDNIGSVVMTQYEIVAGEFMQKITFRIPSSKTGYYRLRFSTNASNISGTLYISSINMSYGKDGYNYLVSAGQSVDELYHPLTYFGGSTNTYGRYKNNGNGTVTISGTFGVKQSVFAGLPITYAPADNVYFLGVNLDTGAVVVLFIDTNGQIHLNVYTSGTVNVSIVPFTYTFGGFDIQTDLSV